ncbi:uncharacterized protein [Ptychodera flava]|uniref:uncharacterized protein n=1 Tax=Ptychodera flava TaxID=63121 RepID=UPI00396A4D94
MDTVSVSINARDLQIGRNELVSWQCQIHLEMETMAGSSLSSYSDDSSSSSDGVDSLHPFNELVLDISRSIDDDTFDQVKILCWRVVPDQKLEKLKKPHELIIELYNMGKITDTNVRYLINIFKKLNLPPLVEKLRNYQKRNQDTSHSLQSRRSKSLPDIEKLLGRGYFELTANLDLSPEQCLEYRSATMMLLTEVQSILAKNCKDQRQRLDEVFQAHQVYIKQIINSSIVVVLVCKSYSALISFKEGVTSGNLGIILTDILVTDEIRSILEGSVIDPHIVINVDQSCFEKAERFFKTMQDKISLAARVRQVEKSEKHCVSVAPLNLMVRKSSSMKSLSRFRELVKVVQKICAERRQLAKKVSDQSLTLDVLHSSYDRVTAQAVKIGDCLLELSISGRHSESMMRLSQQVSSLPISNELRNR